MGEHLPSLQSAGRSDWDGAVRRVPGGIAKGFAVDKAVEVLQSKGTRSGLVNAGGDLRVFGIQSDPVWVRDPQAPGTAQWIGEIVDGAVATSAAYFTADNEAGHSCHSAIVNPSRQRRVKVTGSVSVVANTCMLADA